MKKVRFSNLSHEQKFDEWLDEQAKITLPHGSEYGQTWLNSKQKFVNERGMVGLSDEERTKLSELQNKYRGERIFIIGNGPSLNKTDLSKLKNEYTFAANRFYLLYDRIDWRPTFYTCVDRRVVTDIYHEVNALTGSYFFFDEFFRGLYRQGSDVHFFNQRLRRASTVEGAFSFQASNVIYSGNTVLTYSMQLAFWMGFQEVFLIGCDLGYKVPDTVVQKGDDVFKMGVAFDLKSTKDDDPNHFDASYFGKDRLWHAPNERGMVDDHNICKLAFESRERKIYNATVGGKLEIYERRDFNSLFFIWGQEFHRRDGASIDETAFISNLADQSKKSGDYFMLDVGACGGGSAANFERKRWKVLCFEPDPKNRLVLEKRFKNSSLVSIDPRAVSDQPLSNVPFFSSDQSVGVSSLNAFTDHHELSASVDVTTLTIVMNDLNISKVDFLKIDVEGFDYSVLKGFPWEKCKPTIIECEYEDKKTVPLGNNAQDICNFLQAKGYHVYVSQWHPIIRYGIKHQWKTIVKYHQNFKFSQNEWGNLVCFLHDPSEDQLTNVISKSLRFNIQDLQNQATFKQANKLFRAGKFNDAAELYELLTAKGSPYESAKFNKSICEKKLRLTS